MLKFTAVMAALLALASAAPAQASAMPTHRTTARVVGDPALSWAISPNPAIAGSAELNGVSCPSAGFCAAAGLAAGPGAGAIAYPLVETWNGRRWSVAVRPRARVSPWVEWIAAERAGRPARFDELSCPDRHGRSLLSRHDGFPGREKE